MTDTAVRKFGMGASPLRVEDGSLIRGRGRYVTDVAPAGALVAYVLRSTAGHARIAVSGLDAARDRPGVHLVWTQADIGDLGMMPCLGKGPATAPIEEPPYPVLCGDVVKHVGDAIAFVVAETLDEARSAAEQIVVAYEALPAVADTAAALAPDAPLVWPDRGSNLGFVYEFGDADATAAAFASAARVATITTVNNRIVCNYMEPRAIVAEYDAARDHYTVTVGSQGVHGLRDALCQVLGLATERMRVLTPDVGGGFGTKGFNYREYPLAVRAARVLRRPVRWVSDRSEHFLADAHGRDHVTMGALALDHDGRIQALRIDITANMGAYFNQFAPFIPWFAISMMTGVYDIRTVQATCKGVFTNTVPTDAYRGAGRPEAAYLIERLMDEAARVMALAPDEIRRRNFIRPEQMPYKTVTDHVYDTGEFDGHMRAALAAADQPGFEARAAQSRARGRLRGLGLATYVEICAFGTSEPAKATLADDGTVRVDIGTQSSGQGHATAYAQFVGEPLGVDMAQIRVVQGDTDALPAGGGTGGSRSIPLGAPSVDRAAKLLARQIKELAADALEASVGDIELLGGAARVVGTDRRLAFADLARTATDRSKLTATGEFKAPEHTYPNGTHVCEIEVDPETGRTEILRYTVVDDFGAVVNPMLLAGQIHGGLAQGIGQALLEHTVYDDDAQLVSATFNDYAMPRADDFPTFGFTTRNVPCAWNELGIKGAGEAGTIGSTPAVANALVDALHRGYGIRHFDIPATPLRVWRAIQAAA